MTTLSENCVKPLIERALNDYSTRSKTKYNTCTALTTLHIAQGSLSFDEVTGCARVHLIIPCGDVDIGLLDQCLTEALSACTITIMTSKACAENEELIVKIQLPRRNIIIDNSKQTALVKGDSIVEGEHNKTTQKGNWCCCTTLCTIAILVVCIALATTMLGGVTAKSFFASHINRSDNVQQ